MNLLGAYKTKKEAKNHAESARRAGFKTLIRRDPVTGKWWKVWTGRKSRR